MKNLSIALNCTANSIDKYINVLTPLLNDYNTELIIIDNDISKLDIPYTYTIYGYSHEYKKLRNFILPLCKNDRIVIIEEGLVINDNFISDIKSLLESGISANYSITVNRYISSDLSVYFSDKQVFIYSGNAENTIDTDSIIWDYSLIDSNILNVEKGINLFIEKGSYHNLMLWYSNYILNQNQTIINAFYNSLEKYKNNLLTSEVSLLEKEFLSLQTNSKYLSYLNIMNLYSHEKENHNKIIKLINESKFDEDNIYFSYFIYRMIKSKNPDLEILKSINSHLLSKYLNHLLEEIEDFNYILYNYIMSINLSYETSLPENRNISLYMNIIESYIEFMSNKSENIEKKNQLIQLFIDYCNYGFYMLNNMKRRSKNIIITTQIKFLIEVDKSIDLINKEEIENAVKILRSASHCYQIMERPIEYYIQKLRADYKKYMFTLSICMIVKDEEKNIDRCLGSLYPLIESGLAELILVDTGSTDRTVELAKKYVNKIYYHPWQGSFSEARNYSISLAQGQYIFIMDADEEIKAAELHKIIEEFKGDDFVNYPTFSFKIKNYSDGDYKKYSIMTQNLIFRNDGSFYYRGQVHNQPIYKNPIKHLDVTVDHYGYIMTEDIKDKKFIRTSTLLKKELEKDPNNLYYRFQLSVSYSMHGDHKDALVQAEIYMKQIMETEFYNHKDFNLMYYNNAAIVYFFNHKYREVVKICNDALQLQPDFIDFVYYKGISLFELKDDAQSIETLIEYLSLLDEIKDHEIYNDDRFLFYTLDSREEAVKMIIASYFKLDEYEKVIDLIESLDQNFKLWFIVRFYIESCFKAKLYDKLAKFYSEKILTSSEINLKDTFTYFVEDELSVVNDEEQNKCILEFAKLDTLDEYIDILKIRAGNNIKQDDIRLLKFIDKYEIEQLDQVSAKMIFDRVLPIVNKYVPEIKNSIEIKSYKRCCLFILHRVLNLRENYSIGKAELLSILDKYITVCVDLYNSNLLELLESDEIDFSKYILEAFSHLDKGNLLECLKSIKHGISGHSRMAKPMELFIETIVPGYKPDLDYEKERANFELQEKIIEMKTVINQLINSGCLDEAEEYINILQEIAPKEQEVYSFKSVVNIMKGNFTAAEEAISEGLVKDNKNMDLLLNLSFLKEQTGDYTEAVELYSRAKILNPHKNIKLEEILQTSHKTDNPELRVLHGTMEIANQMQTISNGIKKCGVVSRTLNYYPTYLNYNSDYTLDINSITDYSKRDMETKLMASKLISQNDLFHFHFSTTLALDNSDLPILNELGKKLLMQHWGSDIRILSQALKLNPYARVKNSNEYEIKKSLEFFSSYIKTCAVCDWELYEYVKDYYEKIIFIPQLINLDDFKFNADTNNNNGKLLIVHAPTNSYIKGTEYVLKAVENLKQKYDFDFKLIQNMSYEEAKATYQKADIVVDQVILGSHGLVSVENMALGKAIICWISDYMSEKYPKELPIISANPDNLEEKIEYLINNKDILPELGFRGRKYVEKYHDINTLNQKIVEAYKSI